MTAVPTTNIVPLESCPASSTVCSKKSRQVTRCQSLRSERHTGCLIILLFPELRRSISWRTLSTNSSWKVSSWFYQSELGKKLHSVPDKHCSKHYIDCGCAVLFGQGLSYFVPEIVLGVDDNSSFHLFGQFVDGLLERGWIKGYLVGTFKAKFQFSWEVEAAATAFDGEASW